MLSNRLLLDALSLVKAYPETFVICYRQANSKCRSESEAIRRRAVYTTFVGRNGTRGRENSRERAQYRFNDSGSFSIPSTIWTVDYRQESESLSSLSPAHRSSHPFFTSSSLLCSFLVSWLLIEAPSLSIIRDRMAGAPRLFLRLVERSPPAIRILSPSSSRRAPAIDIASIESDVEGALSGSSRRPEYPAATSSVPPLLLRFLGKLLRWHRWEEVCRTSIPNKVSGPRPIFPSPDRSGISNTFLHFFLSLKSRTLDSRVETLSRNLRTRVFIAACLSKNSTSFEVWFL